jgi:hypothetical protein
MITGKKMRASANRLSLTLCRASASAAAVPMIVESTVVINPTIRLMRSEAISSMSLHASAYQRQVKPRQIVLKRELLKDRITSTTMGA